LSFKPFGSILIAVLSWFIDGLENTFTDSAGNLMPYADELIAQLTKDNEQLREALNALQAKEIEYQELKATLQERENEVNALLGVPPQPVIARFDRQLRHTYVSTAVKLATGIPPEAHIGKTSREMGMPEKILPLWESTLNEVFRKGTEKTIEYTHVLGDRRWTFQSRVVPEFDQPNQVNRVLVITRDITRQKRAEAALLENYEILETVHRLGQVLSRELDAQKLVQTVIDTAVQLTGADFGAFVLNQLDEQGKRYQVGGVSGMSSDVFSCIPLARTSDIFAITLRDKQKKRIDDLREASEFEGKIPAYDMPDGYHPTRSYLAVPVVSQSADILGGLFFGHSEAGVFTERHERVIEGLAAQAAVALDNARLYRESRDQQQQLRITLASIGDAVIATDAEGNITFINPVAQSLTGWSEQEAVDRPLSDVFHIVNETTRETVESPVDKVMREGTIVGLANHTLLLARDGRAIPIDDSGAPIFDENHSLIGIILVFRDITERKQSEQRINLLLELTGAVSQALTMHEIAEVVVERALKALGGLLGTVALLVENGTTLELLNLRGLSTETAKKFRFTSLDFDGPLNEAVRTGQIVWLETYEEYVERYPHFADAIKANGSQSTICIPLQVNEKVIGGFNLSFPVEKPHTPSEEAFFTALAQQCAQSLERARLSGVEPYGA
jgi:PAS domain S-box-containing protein